MEVSSMNKLEQLTLFQNNMPLNMVYTNGADETPLEKILHRMYDPKTCKTVGEYRDQVIQSLNDRALQQQLHSIEFQNLQQDGVLMEELAMLTTNIFDNSNTVALTKATLQKSWIEGTMRHCKDVTFLNSNYNAECEILRGTTAEELVDMIAGLDGLQLIDGLAKTFEGEAYMYLLSLLHHATTNGFGSVFAKILGMADIGFQLATMLAKLQKAAKSIAPAQTVGMVQTQGTAGVQLLEPTNVTASNQISVQQSLQDSKECVDTWAQLPEFNANYNTWSSYMIEGVSLPQTQDLKHAVLGHDLQIQDAEVALHSLHLLDLTGITDQQPEYFHFYHSMMMFASFLVLGNNTKNPSLADLKDILLTFGSMIGIDYNHINVTSPTLQDCLVFDLRHYSRMATLWNAVASNDQEMKSFVLDKFTIQPGTNAPKVNTTAIWDLVKKTDPNAKTVLQNDVVALIQQTGFTNCSETFVNEMAGQIANVMIDYKLQ